MADKPRNVLVDDAAAGDPKLREALAREQGRREMAERMASRQPVSQGPPPEDPLRRFTGDPALTPEEQMSALDRGIRLRALGTVAPVAKDMMDRMERSQFDLENRMAYDAMVSANPKMLEDEALMAAAAGRAQYEFDKAGMPPAPGQFYRRVSEIWRASQPQVETPHLEGEGDALLMNPGGTSASTRKGPNFYEELYGFEGAAVLDGRADTMKGLIEDYIDTKNEGLEKKGIVGPRIAHLRLAQKRKKEAKAAAASAA